MKGDLSPRIAAAVIILAAGPILTLLGLAIAAAVAGQPRELELLALPVAGFAILVGVLIRMDPYAEE